MNNLPIDKNSRAIQCANLGFGQNFEAGILPESVKGYIRIKNIGESDAIIRYACHSNSDGIILSPSETEYFFVAEQLEIVEGSLNIMY